MTGIDRGAERGQQNMAPYRLVSEGAAPRSVQPHPAVVCTASYVTMMYSRSYGEAWTPSVLSFLCLDTAVMAEDRDRLKEACENGDHDVVFDICQKHPRAVDLASAGLRWSYAYDVTCLHIASAKGHVECCRVLLDCGADVEAKDSYIWAHPTDVCQEM